MADRFPLILNTSASQIQEIASGDQLDLTGNNIANAGIVTATAFHGDGSNLTNAGVSLSGSTNNTVATVSGADALVGESNLTFDSSTNKLAVTAADSYVNIGSNSNRLEIRNNGSSSYLYHYGGGGTFHLALAGSSNLIQFDSISQTIAQFKKGAECSLYHSNTKRFETTSTGAKITGDLSVTGVLTYEDVTNVDSVGIITARSGVDVDDFISVSRNIHLGNAGVVTATSFEGDGSALTGVGGAAGIDTTGLSVFNHVNVGGAITCTDTIVNKIDPTTENSVIIGFEANLNNTNTDSCVIIGNRAGYQNATGQSNNTFIGRYAGYAGGGTNGNNNTMIGSGSGMFMYGSGSYNVAVGQEAGYVNNKTYCVSVGANSGHSRGEFNVALGGYANGPGNTMNSYYMTYPNSNSSTQWGDNNIVIGYQANTPNSNASNYIVIGNSKHTNFVVGTLGVEVTAGVTTHAGSVIVGAGASVVGIVTTNSGVDLSGLLREEVKIIAGKFSDNSTINLEDGMVHYFTTQETTTANPNFKFNSSTNLNNVMNIGDTVSVTLIIKAAAGGYPAGVLVDGAGVAEQWWVGGSGPSDGGSSNVDIYTYNIIKTANASFHVIANQTKTS